MNLWVFLQEEEYTPEAANRETWRLQSGNLVFSFGTEGDGGNWTRVRVEIVNFGISVEFCELHLVLLGQGKS
ncbi:hypothetical protein R1flu_023178 [Riccia fluitans]|uniref:Uncharacterized protein n=1 Tax=Riccia fluitans TaxID=41844 RepID=A0ABD1XUA7_9MARC